jgi:hypothetical protein
MIDEARAQQLVDEMRQTMLGVIEAVEAGGDLGAHGGFLHAGLTGVMTLAQFERLMAMLVGAGFLEKRGQVYFVGRRSIETLRWPRSPTRGTPRRSVGP